MDLSFAGLRRLVLFGLGVAVIIDAVVETPTHVGELATGLVLVGLVPVDEFLSRVPK